MISKIPLLPFHPTTLPNCLLSLCLSLSFFEVLWSLFRVTCAGLLASHLRRMASQCRSLLFLSLSLLIVCNFGNGLLFPCASVCVCVCARCGGSSAMAIELKACIVDGSVTGSCNSRQLLWSLDSHLYIHPVRNQNGSTRTEKISVWEWAGTDGGGELSTFLRGLLLFAGLLYSSSLLLFFYLMSRPNLGSASSPPAL